MPSWGVAPGTHFPGVEVGTSFGTPALKVPNRGLICRLRINPDALVVRVIDLADAEALLRGRPAVFFSTPHYDGYPYVLARLDVIDPTEPAELIEDAWRLRAPKRAVAAYDEDRRAGPRRMAVDAARGRHRDRRPGGSGRPLPGPRPR